MAYLSVWAETQDRQSPLHEQECGPELGVEAIYTHLIQLGVICATDGELDAKVRRFSACVVPALERRGCQSSGAHERRWRWVSTCPPRTQRHWTPRMRGRLQATRSDVLAPMSPAAVDGRHRQSGTSLTGVYGDHRPHATTVDELPMRSSHS